MNVVGLVKEFLYANRLAGRFLKPRSELNYWKQHLERRVPAWFDGKQAFRFPFPTEEEKERRYDRRTNAFVTYMKAELRYGSYLSDLQLPADAFVGKRVADIGCGPLAQLLVFDSCERWGFDHLIDAYRRIGYPLHLFDMRFVNCKTEQIPVATGFFDAVVSRNALDHVDDFEKTAAEMVRVLAPGGALVIQTHYHRPTRTEPLVLDDARVLRAFGRCGIQKISVLEGGWGFEDGRTVLWSNRPPPDATAA